MARIRTYKPELFKSLDVTALPLRARWTWLGLWSQCDDHGRYQDVLQLIKAEVWPLDDVSLRDVAEDLETLADHGRIVRYAVEERMYLAVQNWHHHQSINRPGKPKYPDPPVPIGAPEPGEPGHCGYCYRLHVSLTDGAVSPHGAVTTGREGKGRERGGDARSAPPPRTCPRHEGHPDPPACIPCKNARLNHEQWKGDQVDHVKAQRAAVAACRLCDGEGQRFEPGRRIPITPYVRCDHGGETA